MAYTFAVDTDEIVQLKKSLKNAEDLMYYMLIAHGIYIRD